MPRPPIGSRLDRQSRAALTVLDVQGGGPSSTLAGQDTITGAPGEAVDYDWTQQGVPRSRYGVVARAALLAALVFADARPVAAGLAGQDMLQGAPGQVIGYDWTQQGVPGSAYTRRAAQYRAARAGADTQSASLLGTLAGQDTLRGAPGESLVVDWPNPRGPRRAQQPEPSANPQGTVLAPAAPVPSLPLDTPNPARPRRIQPSEQTPSLQDALLVVVPAPPVVPVAWTNPRPRPVPITNRDQATGLVTTTLAGQDTVTGAPGEATAADWTVPRAPRRVQPPEQVSNPQGTVLVLTLPVPTQTFDVPRPRRVQPPEVVVTPLGTVLAPESQPVGTGTGVRSILPVRVVGRFVALRAQDDVGVGAGVLPLETAAAVVPVDALAVGTVAPAALAVGTLVPAALAVTVVDQVVLAEGTVAASARAISTAAVQAGATGLAAAASLALGTVTPGAGTTDGQTSGGVPGP